MVDPYDVLLELLAAPVHGEARASEGRRAWALDAVAASPVDWTLVLADAEYHGVTPLAARALADLSRRGISLPDPARCSFAAVAGRHRAAAASRERVLDDLLGAFAAAGVPALLLKGAALGRVLYGDPALRPMLDLDLLVARADAPRATELVAEAGFVFDGAYGSRFAADMHHLPAARARRSGFALSLDLHTDALSPDRPQRLTMATLAEPPRPVARGAGPPGLTFGHADMLRHLCRHAFEPASRIRLVHLLDVWLYGRRFRDAIDWERIAASSPDVAVAHRLVADLFERDRTGPAPALAAGEGRAMVPMAEIAASHLSPVAKLRALLDPPAWWMHGFYGIEPGRSLGACRGLRHPATVARWIARRLGRRGVALCRSRLLPRRRSTTFARVLD